MRRPRLLPLLGLHTGADPVGEVLPALRLGAEGTAFPICVATESRKPSWGVGSIASLAPQERAERTFRQPWAGSRCSPSAGESFYLVGEFRAVDPGAHLAYPFVWEPPDPDDVETVADLWFRGVDRLTEVSFTQARSRPRTAVRFTATAGPSPSTNSSAIFAGAKVMSAASELGLK